MPLNHFLIIYNRRKGRLISLTDFARDARKATIAYAEAEEMYRDRPDHKDFEIVLVGADSIETIRITHSRYFEEVREVMPFT